MILGLKRLFIAVIFATSTPAFAAEPATTDKTMLREVESQALWLNNINLEFVFRAVVMLYESEVDANQAQADICYRLGDMALAGNNILWETDLASINTSRVDTKLPANIAIFEKVEAEKEKIQAGLYDLKGYCTHSYFAKNPVPQGDHKAFYKRFMQFTDDFLAFQVWSWYDVQGQPQKETVESIKADWMRRR